MKFIVEKVLFEKLPNACFGVVMAKGIDNSKAYPEIDRLLDESITAAAQRFEGKKVKEEPYILPYREAFRSLDINPNKYLYFYATEKAALSYLLVYAEPVCTLVFLLTLPLAFQLNGVWVAIPAAQICAFVIALVSKCRVEHPTKH